MQTIFVRKNATIHFIELNCPLTNASQKITTLEKEKESQNNVDKYNFVIISIQIYLEKIYTRKDLKSSGIGSLYEK